MTLHAESQATVISDAFDPSGLEVLVWAISTVSADNAAAIAAACIRGGSRVLAELLLPAVPGRPERRQLPVVPGEHDDQLQGPGPQHRQHQPHRGHATASASNGTTIAAPGNCGTPADTPSLKAAAPSYCTFTRTCQRTTGNGGDYAVAAHRPGHAQGLPTGQTNRRRGRSSRPGADVSRSPAGLALSAGRNGNGTLGVTDYTTGDLTLKRNTASAVDRDPEPDRLVLLQGRQPGR